jgi:hypothetical protein
VPAPSFQLGTSGWNVNDDFVSPAEFTKLDKGCENDFGFRDGGGAVMAYLNVYFGFNR